MPCCSPGSTSWAPAWKESTTSPACRRARPETDHCRGSRGLGAGEKSACGQQVCWLKKCRLETLFVLSRKPSNGAQNPPSADPENTGQETGRDGPRCGPRAMARRQG